MRSGLWERKKGGEEFFIRMLLKCWLTSQEERTSRTQFGKNGYAAPNEPIRYSSTTLCPYFYPLHCWRKFLKIAFSDALEWLFPLSLLPSPWLKKIFKNHLGCPRKGFSRFPFTFHHGWRKFSKITFSNALKWFFSPSFYLHHGWRKFSKITFLDALEWLF